MNLSVNGGKSISSEVHTLLWDLNSVQMPRPPDTCETTASFIDGLRELPRSGKLIRIRHFELDLPVQSHYDHLIAVAKIAEIAAEPRALSSDAKRITAFHVAFHDLAELLTGDHPDWTSLELIQSVSNLSSGIPLEKALIEIRQALPPMLQEQFDKTCGSFELGADDSFQIFKFADKIEPIIAVWRYLKIHKDRMDAERFLDAMTDFFENSKVVEYCCSEEQLAAVRFFQSKSNALQYLQDGEEGSLIHTNDLITVLLSDVVDRLKMHTV